MPTATKTKAELEKELEELKAKLDTPPETPPEENVTQAHIPQQYLDAVHTILNKRFGVEMEYQPDTPNFGFSILVPKEYSNAGEPHWAMFHEDRRTRVINNSEGSAGVKLWVEKVYNNFDMETRTRITADRNA